MTEPIFQDLVKHLDDLPGGFPPSRSDADIRVLQRLFTPQEANLAVHLGLIAEPPKVVARRAGLPVAEVEKRLQEMARKGLIFCYYKDEKPVAYSAISWVFGIFEFQVNKLNLGLLNDIRAYYRETVDPDSLKVGPQLRTIPVGESIPVQQEIWIHEQAKELINTREKFAVAPCVCRQRQKLLGSDCDKPEETCLMFNEFAEYYVQNDLGREIDRSEALTIIDLADEYGLILQPSNTKEAMFICSCCGDCCGVLEIAKLHPQPATVLSSPYIAQLDIDTCNDCYVCTTRCQMEALEMGDDSLIHHKHHCIGCGLCVTTCTTGALSLVRKPEAEQPVIPKDFAAMQIKHGRTRGILENTDLIKMIVRSKIDRILS